MYKKRKIKKKIVWKYVKLFRNGYIFVKYFTNFVFLVFLLFSNFKELIWLNILSLNKTIIHNLTIKY